MKKLKLIEVWSSRGVTKSSVWGTFEFNNYDELFVFVRDRLNGMEDVWGDVVWLEHIMVWMGMNEEEIKKDVLVGRFEDMEFGIAADEECSIICIDSNSKWFDKEVSADELLNMFNMNDSIVDYLYEHFDVDGIMEDFGLNGWDYIKSLSKEEIDEEFEDYRL